MTFTAVDLWVAMITVGALGGLLMDAFQEPQQAAELNGVGGSRPTPGSSKDRRTLS